MKKIEKYKNYLFTNFYFEQFFFIAANQIDKRYDFDWWYLIGLGKWFSTNWPHLSFQNK